MTTTTARQRSLGSSNRGFNSRPCGACRASQATESWLCFAAAIAALCGSWVNNKPKPLLNREPCSATVQCNAVGRLSGYSKCGGQHHHSNSHSWHSGREFSLRGRLVGFHFIADRCRSIALFICATFHFHIGIPPAVVDLVQLAFSDASKSDQVISNSEWSPRGWGDEEETIDC